MKEQSELKEKIMKQKEEEREASATELMLEKKISEKNNSVVVHQQLTKTNVTQAGRKVK